MTARLLREAEARSLSVGAPPVVSPGVGSVDQIVSDMYGPPYNAGKGAPWAKADADPTGSPASNDWTDGANGSTSTTFPADGSAVRPWFWIADIATTTSHDYRMEIKKPLLQFLVSGVWTTQTPPSNPEAHNFAAFGAPGVGDQGVTTRRSESGDGATAFSWSLQSASSSSTLGLAGAATYFMHGWWDNGGTSGGGWFTIPANTTAVHWSYQMRIITDIAGDPTLAKFVAVAGADKIQFPSGVYTWVGGYGECRPKYVADQWVALSYTTPLTEAQIRANPPTVQT